MATTYTTDREVMVRVRNPIKRKDKPNPYDIRKWKNPVQINSPDVVLHGLVGGDRVMVAYEYWPGDDIDMGTQFAYASDGIVYVIVHNEVTGEHTVETRVPPERKVLIRVRQVGYLPFEGHYDIAPITCHAIREKDNLII